MTHGLEALSNQDLDDFFGKLSGYLGTYSKDLLHNIKIPSNEVSFIIFNLEDSDKGFGTHWTCSFMNPNDKNNYYFDSYGVEPPEDVIKWMKKDKKKIIYNTTEIQNIDSTSCGYYCIMFIIWMLVNGDYVDFIHKFENNGDIHLHNEKVLVQYLDNLL